MTLVQTEPKKIYLGNNELKAVYLGENKVRPSIIPVTGVSLNTSSLSFTEKNQTSQLTATVSPSGATNKNVTWSSSNTSVATVSSTGLVTCKGVGNCTITVTTQDGGYTASCGITAFWYRTFTIQRTEKSNMTSGWTYSDDAAGLTAGSGEFDNFFGYSAVLLNTSGSETATMNQTNGTFTGTMTSLGNITSGDNVMIKFPKRGIKMEKSNGKITLSITDKPNRSGYQYYAFNRNGTQKNQIYIGAYKGCYNGTALKSRSGKGGSGASTSTTPRINYLTLTNACNYAKANGTGYQICTWYIRQYISCLYMMKYGNPNSQSVVGAGYTPSAYGDTVQSTGGTNSIKNATGATSTGDTGRIKLFGLEDRRGNISEWVDGAYFSSKTNLKTGTTQEFKSSGQITSFDTNTSVSRGYLGYVSGTNTGMFACIGTGSSGSYYTDSFYSGTSEYAQVGGGISYGTNAGIFCVNNFGASEYGLANGARLCYV